MTIYAKGPAQKEKTMPSHDQPSLGKFEGNGSRRLSEALYNLTMGCGLNEELGNVQDFGWYGLVKRRKHGYIVHEDNNGFFDYAYFGTLQSLQEAWAELETEYEEFCEEFESEAE